MAPTLDIIMGGGIYDPFQTAMAASLVSSSHLRGRSLKAAIAPILHQRLKNGLVYEERVEDRTIENDPNKYDLEKTSRYRFVYILRS